MLNTLEFTFQKSHSENQPGTSICITSYSQIVISQIYSLKKL